MNKLINSIEDIKKEKTKRIEVKEIVLQSIALSLIVGGSIVFPNLPIVIGTILKIAEEVKGFKIPKQKIRRVLTDLEKKDILYIEKKDNEVFVHIKNMNHVSILKYSIQSLLEHKKKQKGWNGKWYLVFFDVPEIQRKKRDYLRRFLKELGFFPYQKSVYIFPYECKKEIQLIKQIVEGGKYIKYIVAEKIESENTSKIFFKI